MLGANQDLTIESWVPGDERDAEGRRVASFVENVTVRGNLFERATRQIIDNVWTTVADWVAILPPTISVTHKDVIIDSLGRRFRIEAVRVRLAIDGLPHHVACMCVLVEEQ